MHRQDLQTNSGTTDSETINTMDDNTIEIPGLIKNKRFPERLSKEHIKTLPVCAFDGKIHLITEIKEVSNAIKTLRKYPILGFDTETRPVFRKGVKHNVSLLQLSTPKEAFLFRLNHLGFPNELVALVEDSTILKVGLAILDDVRGLQKLSNF
ncbi:3'-5' exonuclease domain-containing protein 2, partial [Deltaproteobacteria bacterium]|nr:3'-5' exonuclease domain-containing protein 2 [Deltaproteobacteria bacterium]